MRDYRPQDLYPNTKVLSSTQVLDYAKSPKDFYAKWVAGFDRKASTALHVGIAFGELYADRSFDYRAYLSTRKVPARLIELVGRAITYFPKATNPEYEMRVEHNGWVVRITYDDFYPDQKLIVEHKTSALEWTQETVDNHDQITLQEWGYWRKYGKLAKHIVNWVDTDPKGTKLVQTLKTHRTKYQLIAFEEQVVNRVLAGIDAGNFTNPLF